MIPIPSEQLYHPVRVCDDCFAELVRTKKKTSLVNPDEQSVAVDNTDHGLEEEATTSQEAF